MRFGRFVLIIFCHVLNIGFGPGIVGVQGVKLCAREIDVAVFGVGPDEIIEGYGASSGVFEAHAKHVEVAEGVFFFTG